MSPDPDDDEVAALLVTVASLADRSNVVETKPAPPARWLAAARREAVQRLRAAPRVEDGWRGGGGGMG
jgi:hypothetical protein